MKRTFFINGYFVQGWLVRRTSNPDWRADLNAYPVVAG